MKKILFFCILCVLSASSVSAQFEKGHKLISPSLTGLGFSYNKAEKLDFGLGAKIGSFVTEGIAVYVHAGGDWSESINTYNVGTGARFYFNKTGIFIGANFDWNRFKLKDLDSKRTDWGPGIEAGYAFFLSRTVTIEPALTYKWRLNNSDRSEFGLQLGFGFYL